MYYIRVHDFLCSAQLAIFYCPDFNIRPQSADSGKHDLHAILALNSLQQAYREMQHSPGEAAVAKVTIAIATARSRVIFTLALEVPRKPGQSGYIAKAGQRSFSFVLSGERSAGNRKEKSRLLPGVGGTVIFSFLGQKLRTNGSVLAEKQRQSTKEDSPELGARALERRRPHAKSASLAIWQLNGTQRCRLCSQDTSVRLPPFSRRATKFSRTCESAGTDCLCLRYTAVLSRV